MVVKRHKMGVPLDDKDGTHSSTGGDGTVGRILGWLGELHKAGRGPVRPTAIAAYGFLLSKTYIGCWRILVVMAIFHKMDFSLPGFLICCTLLGFGRYEAMSLDHGKKDNVHSTDITIRIFVDQNQRSPLPT
ncbi:hypothetical protein L1987_23430 [Smallanthus sonchifolius]|uniref:Uncharacterized protein n=1 Tax=Smallanthus sonchifolius TaxID=185202 RepID=A0ACB9IJE0_9ASTR|nr:hypothetical protein L1987_23430 [Smallanthus sonchifolius]